MEIKCYTDGSCRANGSDTAIGAWAFAIIIDDNITHYETKVAHNTTNQRMELEAMLEACRWIKLNGSDYPVTFYSDSAYLINCYNQKWYKNWLKNGWLNSKRQLVSNRDLWIELIPYFDNPDFIFTKTKGHADDKYNNFVDALAQKATAEEKNVSSNYTSI